MKFQLPRALALTALLSLSLSTIHAQDWAKSRLDASPRHHEYITLKHDNRSLQAFVVYPETKSKVPTVILIHEIFGLSDWAKEMADENSPRRASSSSHPTSSADTAPTTAAPTHSPARTTA